MALKGLLELHAGGDTLLVGSAMDFPGWMPTTGGNARAGADRVRQFTENSSNASQARDFASKHGLPSIVYSDRAVSDFLVEGVRDGRFRALFLGHTLDLTLPMPTTIGPVPDTVLAALKGPGGTIPGKLTKPEPVGKDKGPPVYEWPLLERLVFVVKYAATPERVGKKVAEQLLEFFTLDNLKMMALFMAASGAAQFTPVGWTVDAALLALAYYSGGMALVAALSQLIEACIAIYNARTQADLERAGEIFAGFIAAATIALLSALLERFARRLQSEAPPKKQGGGNEKVEPRKQTEIRDRAGRSFPDRELPRDKHGKPITDPEATAAHTQLGTKEGRKGKYPQAREFDDSGQPVKDIDFTDHGRPGQHADPHEHPYEPNPTGGTPKRGEERPLNSGDKDPPSS